MVVIKNYPFKFYINKIFINIKLKIYKHNLNIICRDDLEKLKMHGRGWLLMGETMMAEVA